jgi:AraC family transcriptional regulator
MTPKEWKKGGYKLYSDSILQQSQKAMNSRATFEHLEPTIVKRDEINSYYIRHHGYDASIKQTWQKLQAWIFTNNLSDFQEIALFHDNPTITPLSECQYVACIALKEDKIIQSHQLPKFKIASGVYAKFDLNGEQGDILKFIHWVYHEWLPQSDYETSIKPPYAIYKKNNYLSEDACFEMSFFIPIKY